MILADKIIALRKRSGWSQEELAEQLGVSRQSVSKWEGAQSVPDLDKILQLSKVFGVTTDYLLKDEIEEAELTSDESESPLRRPLRRVTMETAAEYLRVRKNAAPKRSAGVFLCIISPICLFLLGAASEIPDSGISEYHAGGIGMCVLIVLIAAAVGLFCYCGAREEEFKFLEKEPFDREYGVEGMVRERAKAAWRSADPRNIAAIVLLVLSPVPLFLSAAFGGSDMIGVIGLSLLLLFVAAGASLLTYTNIFRVSFDRLLEEGDYIREKKEDSGKNVVGVVTTVYWLLVTAGYMIYLFVFARAGSGVGTWLIWAVAGVLYGAVAAVLGLFRKKKK